jgi:hypothetical protein
MGADNYRGRERRAHRDRRVFEICSLSVLAAHGK